MEGVEVEPTGEGRDRSATDLVKLRVEVPPDAKPGRYPIRLITANGVSNALPLHIVDFPVLAEPAGVHETAGIGGCDLQAAGGVRRTPRAPRRGGLLLVSARKPARLLTFEVISGFPQIAAAGSAATVANFDPALTIYERCRKLVRPQAPEAHRLQ